VDSEIGGFATVAHKVLSDILLAMKIIALAALSLDGYMTRHDDEGNSFTSGVEKEFFARVLNTFNCSVFGSATFDAAREQILAAPPARRLRLVLTTRPEAYAPVHKHGFLEFAAGPPREIAEKLRERGKARCALLGGTRVFTDFLEAGLIDEFWISFEPVFFGSGKRLLEGRLDRALELLGIEDLGGSVLVAKYRVPGNLSAL